MGNAMVGGLIGESSSDVSNCRSSGTVDGGNISGGPKSDVGGLIGDAEANVTDSYSTGAVTGSGSYFGGLIGYANGIGGLISDCYSKSSVTVTGDQIGGLVGWIQSTNVTDSFATGDVKVTGYDIGGLIGLANGTVAYSHATGNASGTENYVGGLIGEAYDTVTYSYAMGNVTTGTGDGGGLIGDTDSGVLNSYSIGAVNCTGYCGGLIAYTSSSVTSSYYNSDTSLQSDTGKGEPRSTTQMKNPSTYSGWDIGGAIYLDLTGILNNGYPIYRDQMPYFIFPNDQTVSASGIVTILPAGNLNDTVWFAPVVDPASFVEGTTMTMTTGDSTTISAPSVAGYYFLYVVNSSGVEVGESDAILTVQDVASPTPTPTGTSTPTDTPTPTPTPTPTDTPTTTPTPTDTSTPTASPTPTPTDTSTPTASPTPTPTDTPASTPTPTDTFTSTSSQTTVTTSTASAPGCTDTKPFSVPNLFQIDVTDTTAKLFFTPLINTNEYFIAYSTQANAEEYGVQVTLGNGGVQNFTINLLKPGTVYYFKVRGQNGCMPGDWSNIMKVVTNKGGVLGLSTFYKNTIVTTQADSASSSSALAPILPKSGTNWATFMGTGIGILGVVGAILLAI